MTCHGLSKTLSRNLSRMGFSQLAHWSMVSGDIPKPARGLDMLVFFKLYLFMINIGFSDVLVTRLVMIQTIQSVQSERDNYATILEVKRCSFVPHRSTIHTGPTAPNHWRNSISEAAVGCRSRLSLKPSEVGAQFKGKSRLFFF